MTTCDFVNAKLFPYLAGFKQRASGPNTIELDSEKLSPLLRLRYRALSDAVVDLGQPDQIRAVFVGFQRHLHVL